MNSLRMRVLVQDSVHDDLRSDSPGRRHDESRNGFEPGAVIGPLTDVKGVEKIEARITDGVNKGCKVVNGGNRRAGQHLCEPTVSVSAVPVAMSSAGSRRAR